MICLFNEHFAIFLSLLNPILMHILIVHSWNMLQIEHCTLLTAF